MQRKLQGGDRDCSVESDIFTGEDIAAEDLLQVPHESGDDQQFWCYSREGLLDYIKSGAAGAGRNPKTNLPWTQAQLNYLLAQSNDPVATAALRAMGAMADTEVRGSAAVAAAAVSSAPSGSDMGSGYVILGAMGALVALALMR